MEATHAVRVKTNVVGAGGNGTSGGGGVEGRRGGGAEGRRG